MAKITEPSQQKTPNETEPQSRPFELTVRIAKYMLVQKLKGRSRFPMVTLTQTRSMRNSGMTAG